MEDVINTIKILQNSPKGKLVYQNGWDEQPNAITGLIAKVQEEEIDSRNRQIVDNAYRTFQPFDSRRKYDSKQRRSSKGRHSFPETLPQNSSEGLGSSSSQSPTLISLLKMKVSKDRDGETFQRSDSTLMRRYNSRFSEPRIEVEEVEWNSDDVEGANSDYLDSSFSIKGQRMLLTPPSYRDFRRKKVVDTEGSPIFKPSPTFSSSTLTQTHSSTTSDATTATPTRIPTQTANDRVSNRIGVYDEHDENEAHLEDELYMESKSTPYSYINTCVDKYQDDLEKRIQLANKKRMEGFRYAEEKANKLSADMLLLEIQAKKNEAEAIKRKWIEAERANLQEFQLLQQNRLKQEEKLQQERIVAADAAERNRRAVLEAAQKQEQLRMQKLQEDEQRKKEQEAANAANQEKERLDKVKAAEAKKLADQADALKSKQKAEEDKKKQQETVPELSGLILREDLLKYAKTNEVLKQFEDPVVHIDGKDPGTKAFYIGAVKCINTPLNALADTNEHEILKKVEHFRKLLSGEPVSGGGSMNTMFSCASIPQGEYFVMKTLAFRFVKKAEADVTRGKSTVQPLATVGVHLCKLFPAWATLVQANMYKLCPFLVPFSYPQGEKTIQEYARELGHELSGTENAIQQTFLERLKGYCTLYALMVVKFHKDGAFEIGDATEFFTIGGAWHILARTMKLEPQVDVTATVIHTLLDILDDTLYAVYRTQFAKLMRLLILTYLPKIKGITPPAKSGSVSRLQIYVEKKFAV